MNVDERLRESLQRRAELVEPSFDAWAEISRRVERRQRRTRTMSMTLAAGLSFSAVALVVVLASVAGPDSTEQHVATGGPNPANRSTTSYLPSSPITVPDGQAAPTIVPGQSPTEPGPAGGPANPGGPGPVVTGNTYVPAAVFPETLTELERLQAAVGQGSQPWRNDPEAVAMAYLGDRGLPTPQIVAPQVPAPDSDSASIRYTSGGVDGWVYLTKLSEGSIFFVESSRSDRIRQVSVVRNGDRLAVDVTATTSGKVVVRTKPPGSDWNEASTRSVVAGRPASFDVVGQASIDLIVQVRHDGDDGRTAISEQYLRAPMPATSYEALHDGSIIGPGGLGDVSLGNSLAQAERAAGIPMRLVRTEHCATLSPVGAPEGVSFVSVGSEDSVDVFLVDAPGVRTATGIGIGSGVDEVRQAYPGIEERLTDGQGRMILRAEPGSATPLEMFFQVAGGKVTSIWSGMTGISNTDELCA